MDLKKSIPGLKTILWHGLARDEPLLLEDIFRSCFLNPRRENLPDIFMRRGWGYGNKLSNDLDSADVWIRKIPQAQLLKFNA